MRPIRQVTVVERSTGAWLYVETYCATEDGHCVTAHELMAVFSSVAALFERWDVEGEPHLDVAIFFRGEGEPRWE